MSSDVHRYALESLMSVGPEKVVGYLPLRTVTQGMGLKVKDVIANATIRGLKAISIESHNCCIRSGALYVFDEAALQILLHSAAETLQRAGAPTDPEMFVRLIAREWFSVDHSIMPVIRSAFAEN